jgi:hypothetical protein
MGNGFGDREIANIIKKGQMLPAQDNFYDGDGRNDRTRNDLLYDVSPTDSQIMALIRICADADEEYVGKEKADLLLIPHTCHIGSSISIPELIEVHGSYLKDTAFIVTANALNGNEPIYDTQGRVVSERKEYKKNKYHETVFIG